MEDDGRLMSRHSQLARLYITVHLDLSGSGPGLAWPGLVWTLNTTGARREGGRGDEGTGSSSGFSYVTEESGGHKARLRVKTVSNP
eukprot:superscaffoldBa00000200_g2661